MAKANPIKSSLTTHATNSMTSIDCVTPAFERVHDGWQAIINQAIENWKPFRSSLRLMAITEATAVVVWDLDHVSVGTDNWTTSDLICALLSDANRSERRGLEITAKDQRWLAQLLKSGDLTVIGAHHL